MKRIAVFLLSLFCLAACTTPGPSGNTNGTQAKDSVTSATKERKVAPSLSAAGKGGIPADGTYRYDVAFAEWQGKSMGVYVSVRIEGEQIEVIYEGGGNIPGLEQGTILDEGMLRKHKSGRWIIVQEESEVQAEEVGGCTDGPSVIDFENQKFWMC